MSGSAISLRSTGTINPRFANYFRPSNLNLDGYIGLYIFGGSPLAGETAADVLKRSCINLLKPTQVCAVVGSPTVEADGMVFDDANHLISPHGPLADFTFAAMCKNVSGSGQHIVSNYGLPSITNCDFLFNAGGTAPAGNIKTGYGIDVAGTPSVWQSPNNFDADFASWSLALGMGKGGAANAADVGVYAGDLFQTLFRFTPLTTAGATRRIDAGAGNYRFGGVPGSGTGSKLKIRYLLIGSRIRTASERTELAAFVRSRAAADNITVPSA